MAKYVMQDMPDLNGDGKRTKYPRMIIQRQVNLKYLARRIADASTFTQGDVEGLITELATEMARSLAEGASVKVDGVGVFAPALGLRDGAEREGDNGVRRNAHSIEVASLYFRPDGELLLEVNKHCHLERTASTEYTSPNSGSEARLELAYAHIREEGALSVVDYMIITGLSRSSAWRELSRLHAKGLLSRKGLGAHCRYTLP